MVIWIHPLGNILIAKISAPDFAAVVTGVVYAAVLLVSVVVGDNLGVVVGVITTGVVTGVVLSAVTTGVVTGLPPVASTRQIEEAELMIAASVGSASMFAKQELQANALGVTIGQRHASSEQVVAALKMLAHAAEQGSRVGPGVTGPVVNTGVPPVASIRQAEAAELMTAASVGSASTLTKQELQAAALRVTVGQRHASSGQMLAASKMLAHAPAQGSV
jgi:hypothetical protein